MARIITAEKKGDSLTPGQIFSPRFVDTIQTGLVSIIESYHGRRIGSMEGESSSPRGNDIIRGNLSDRYEIPCGAVLLRATYSFDSTRKRKPVYDIFISNVEIFGMHGTSQADELADRIKAHFERYRLTVTRDGEI